MTTTADRETATGTGNGRAYRVLGTRPIRHDGLDKVTGRARYGADIHLPGMLHGKVLRSPYAHARIKQIDASKALALPGVRAVISGVDFPILHDRQIDFGETLGNVRVVAENAMAKGKALYKGHAVAAVAATSPSIAEEALKLIEVEYEPLPVVLTWREAMAEGAALLHDDLTTRTTAERFGRGTDTGVQSNIASHLIFQGGDLEQGFKDADVVLDREYSTSTVHQGYIEPHTSTARWGEDGRVTVWTSSQGHFGMRDQTAAILGLPNGQVKVIPMEIGGGFGGKTVTYLDPLTALLSKKTGAPVKITMSRTEVFEASGPTSATFIRVKLGARRDGRLTAAQLYLVYEAGAFPGSPMGAGAGYGLAPYRIENFLVDGYDVVVNKPKVAAYRAPGVPQAAFAIESAMDELAQQLALDPLALRRLNANGEGDRLPSGVKLGPVGNVEIIERMQKHPHYNAPLEGPNKGRGIALGFWGNGGNQSSCTINVNADGTIAVISGSVDIGGTRPAVAMQAAEVLGLSAQDAIPSVGDTDSVGWTGVTGGSRTAFSTGIAAITAAEEVKRQMIGRAALLWEGEPADVEFNDGVFISKKNPEVKMTFKELAGRLARTGGPVSASAVSNPRQVGPAYAGHIVDVEVDPETGKVQILRYTAFQDAGLAAHPSYVEGQVQGGAAQGIGWALNEEYVWSKDGAMLNASFLDYRMPTALDLPMIDTVIVEVPNPGHPFGLRGVGEVAIVPPQAAVANAIQRATGARLYHTPMSPGAIVEAMEAQAKR
ncbi:MAG TPA: xanthine dehydrogenase family protein molybdopterin-binding subunit [Dehalococcoidia bacterium]|nr:xanthine dehydrogenase family protein molybdopterin-binding subunit [Dehalococcoidia bacterium]